MKELVKRCQAGMNALLLLTLAMLWASISKSADPLTVAHTLAEAANRAQADLPSAQRIDMNLVDPEAGFYYLPKEVISKGEQVVKLLETKGLDYHYEDRGDLVSAIRELSNLIRQSGAGDNATFENIATGVEPRVSVSSIGVSASASQLMVGYVVVVIFILLYLLSHINAMKPAIIRDQDPVSDWIFFHPGWLGYCLGMAWLMCPLLVFASRDFSFRYGFYSAAYLAELKDVGLALVAVPYLFCLANLWWRIRKIRRVSLSLQAIAVPSEAILVGPNDSSDDEESD